MPKKTKISPTLREHILDGFRELEPLLLKTISEAKDIKDRYMKLFVAIDGVVDSVRYDTKTEKFDQIEILMATQGVSPGLLPHTAYCDDYETVIIKLD